MPEGHPRWKEIDEKLATDDVARVVDRQVNQLDREQVDQLYRGIGRMPFDPVILLKMVLYQYLKGRQSPAAWYEEARLNEAMQWLGQGYQPGRRTWYEFRDRLGGGIGTARRTSRRRNPSTTQPIFKSRMIRTDTNVARRKYIGLLT